MTKTVQLDPTAWSKVDTSGGDVLLSGSTFYINVGDAAPAKDAACHCVNQPVIVPKDVVAHVRGQFPITGSVLGTGDPF